MKENKIKKYSILRKLKSEDRITEEMIQLLDCIALEDLIALKLELLCRLVKGKLYGLRLYDSMPYLARDAVVKFAFSTCKNKKDVSGLLGISYNRVTIIEREKELESFFRIKE